MNIICARNSKPKQQLLNESASSAYIASLGNVCGRRGRHSRNVRKAASMYTMKSTGDSVSPCGVPTVELNGADRTSSTPTVIFTSPIVEVV